MGRAETHIYAPRARATISAGIEDLLQHLAGGMIERRGVAPFIGLVYHAVGYLLRTLTPLVFMQFPIATTQFVLAQCPVAAGRCAFLRQTVYGGVYHKKHKNGTHVLSFWQERFRTIP
jgi:hypothetical protein